MDDLPYIWQVRRKVMLPSQRYAFDERYAICSEQPDVTEEQALQTAWEEVNES